MKKIVLVMFAAAGLFLISSCASSSENSEVMVDTAAKTKKDVPDGASEPGDASRMADPFLSGN
jgi:hypothetical protein